MNEQMNTKVNANFLTQAERFRTMLEVGDFPDPEEYGEMIARIFDAPKAITNEQKAELILMLEAMKFFVESFTEAREAMTLVMRCIYASPLKEMTEEQIEADRRYDDVEFQRVVAMMAKTIQDSTFQAPPEYSEWVQTIITDKRQPSDEKAIFFLMLQGFGDLNKDLLELEPLVEIVARCAGVRYED